MSANENLPPPPIERVCPKCGRVLKREWNACPDCGWTPTSNISHGTAIASIACGIVGIFFLGILFGLLGTGLGASAVMRRDKDNLGYVGLVLGVIVFVLSIIGMFFWYRYIYFW